MCVCVRGERERERARERECVSVGVCVCGVRVCVRDIVCMQAYACVCVRKSVNV